MTRIESQLSVYIGVLSHGCVKFLKIFNLYMDDRVKKLYQKVVVRRITLRTIKAGCLWEVKQLLFTDDPILVADSLEEHSLY